MKLSTDLPPNWKKLIAAFPAARELKPFVTYGDTIYCPSKISPELYDHECLHGEQQETMGVEKWWKQYFEDKEFRYSQELPAYKIQIKRYNKDHKDKNVQAQYMMGVVRILSGAEYGNCADYHRVFKDIRS